MNETAHDRIYLLLVLLCILLSMNTLLILNLIGWGSAVFTIVIGLVFAIILTSITSGLVKL